MRPLEERFQFLAGDVVGLSPLAEEHNVRRRVDPDRRELGVVFRTPKPRTNTVSVIWDRQGGRAARKSPQTVHADHLVLVLRDE